MNPNRLNHTAAGEHFKVSDEIPTDTERHHGIVARLAPLKNPLLDCQAYSLIMRGKPIPGLKKYQGRNEHGSFRYTDAQRSTETFGLSTMFSLRARRATLTLSDRKRVGGRHGGI